MHTCTIRDSIETLQQSLAALVGIHDWQADMSRISRALKAKLEEDGFVDDLKNFAKGALYLMDPSHGAALHDLSMLRLYAGAEQKIAVALIRGRC
jgi:hypothetical protein